MHVDVALFEHRGPDAKGVAARLDEAFGRLNRFLHYVAQLARCRDPTLAGQGNRLDRQQLAAYFGPGEPRRDPNQVLGLDLAEPEPPDPGVFLDVAARHSDPLGLLHQNVFDRLAGEVGDLALEIAHSSFAGVVANEVAD